MFSMSDPRLDRLAQVLVQYSVGVQPGQLVSLVGPPLAEPLILALYRHVLRAGAHPLVRMTPEACAELLLREGNDEQVGFVSPLEEREIEKVDAIIHALAPLNTRALTGIAPARQALRSKARGPIMERFLERAATKELHWVVTQLPCDASSHDAEMSLSEYSEFVFRAGLLHEPDPPAAWRELSARQARLADFLNGVREVHFTTPRGTDLRVGVAGRTWINCDGHENFPDGEVFTGPIEDATEGTVRFDFPAVHGGREVDGVRLTFRAGRIVDATADKGEEFLLRMLDQDAGARVLGEIAIGCNYAIQRYTKNTLFDEKIGGTFHAAVGASYPESGGKNRSGLHWDMVCDLRAGGRIQADGKIISENGKFVNADWPC
jgi:aminopeptidase